MTDAQQRAAAKAFAKNWKDRGYEKGDSQIFWVELLTTVFGVSEISQFISFEDQVHLDHTSFIDGYIEKTHVMIEQKSINKSLTAAIRQSDGSMLTPFEQAKRYSSELPYSKRPRWIVIKKLLMENGYTVKDVQNAMGFENPQAIYKWISGRSLPSLDNFVILSRLLHTSIEDILVVDGDVVRLWGIIHDYRKSDCGFSMVLNRWYNDKASVMQ